MLSLILGSPLKPDAQLVQEHLVDDFVLNRLRWNTSFTWPEFPITNYTVSMYNHSNGETTVTIWTATTADQYTHLFVSSGEHCYAIDFTVVAVNRLGKSQPITIPTGHPIGKYNIT